MLAITINLITIKHAQLFVKSSGGQKSRLIAFAFNFLLPFLVYATPGVVINEVSNGPSGSQEWVELLVVGDRFNPTDPVDLTGWIVDDNNGDFEGSLTGVGIAQGYIAFSNAWNAVPPGSLIVIYNNADRDPLIPADDVFDSNGDLVYIVPANDGSLSGCSSNPTTASTAYLPCTLTTSIWSRSSLRNGGDAIQVRMPDGSFYHGFSYGDVGAPFPTFSSPGAPSSWNAGSGGTGSTFAFQCGDWEDSSEYVRSTAAGRTPGTFNSADNGNFINNVRYGHLNYNSLGNPNNCIYSPPTLTMTKTVSNNNPDPGEVFNFIIDASCNSSTEDCDNVVIVDTLPGTVEFLNFSSPLPDGVSSATYDLATREIVISFDASACGSCSPDGIGDENDFAQGASVQVLIQVQFPDGTIDGYQADNTAYAYSNNAPNTSSNAIATVNNGATPGDFPDYKGGDSQQIAGGYQYWSIEVGNIGFDDITNYEIIDTIPDSVFLDQVRTPEFTDLDHSIDLYYMRSDNPGVWVFWDNFNMNNRRSKFVSALGLPPSVRISQVRLNMYDVPATGLYNPYIYPDGFTRNWVLYGITSSNLSIADNYTNCAYYSGISAGGPITDIACNATNIVAPTNNVTGGIAAYDTALVERVTYNIEDTVVVGVEFASPGLMGSDVIGGVLSVILPPGLEYVTGSHYFDFGDHNADFQIPVVETEVIIDGRQLVRFVFDSSYSNSFIIEPTGGWEGFRINFESVIRPATSELLHTIEYYYNATGSDPNNCGDLDIEDYLNGYAPDRCADEVDILVVRPPTSAGLQSKIEVIGTLDLDYSRYPNYGRTVPGGISDYRIVLKNPNAATLDELTFITTLPHVGDTEVLDSSAPRYSEWQPFMVGAVAVPTGMDVYYSTATNPCRDELAGSNPTPFPSGCNAASWSLTPPVDITTVTALKFEYGSNTLVQGDSIVVTWPMRAPVNGVPDTSIAWNSFAYQVRNTATSTYLLPAEPIKVGIELLPGNLPIVGDFVWHDSIINGIQDIGEPGIDGVLVELYHDVNNNGIQEPNAGDTLEAFTRTNNGGLYLFSDFDYGRYFLVFSDLPTGFNPTYQDVTTDDMDSDGLISDVILFDNTVETYDLDLGLQNGVIPEICNDGIDNDGDGDVDYLDSDCDCPNVYPNPIDFDFSNASVLTGTGLTLGDQILYSNVGDINGQGVDIVATVTNLFNLVTLEEHGNPGAGDNGMVELPSMRLVAGTEYYADIRYVLYETGTSIPISGSFEIEIADIDSISTARVEIIGASQNELDYYYLNDPSNLTIQSSNNFLSGTGTADQSSADAEGTIKYTFINRDTFTLRYGMKQHLSTSTGRAAFIIDGNSFGNLGECILGEICTDTLDNDGDGLIDCLDPDCDMISLTNSISSCIDHPLEDIAQLTVDVSWTTPLNDTLELAVAGSSQIILMDTASSPTSVVFNVPADGSIDNIIIASWGYYNSGCTEIDSFDTPAPCSNDSIACNILYLCGDEKPSDGDAWDHGWIEYLDRNNGTSIVDAVFTKDEPGQGTYDPMDETTFINIDYSKYDLIIVSATTEDHISSDLVDVLKGQNQSIILANYQQVQAFELSTVAGFYVFDDDLYIDNVNSTQIYNYRNSIDPLYNNVFTLLDYRSDANAYLWNTAGAQVAENQGVYVHYEASDVFPTITSHGPRTYFGLHMNQLYANQRNEGPSPTPMASWFHPAKDLTTAGKLFFDQMIIEAASECGINCQIATMNPHVMYYRRKE